MNRLLYAFCFFCQIAYACNPANAALFTVFPSDGALSGPPGATLRWDYTIANDDPANWLVLTGINTYAFYFGSPTDIFDYPILAPGKQSTGGLYKFTWDASAPVGFSNSGIFSLSAELWNGDPLGGGAYVSPASLMEAEYVVKVSSSQVPVPASFLLFGSGLLGMGFGRRYGLKRRWFAKRRLHCP